MKKLILTLTFMCVAAIAFGQTAAEPLVCTNDNRRFLQQPVRNIVIPKERDFMVSSRGGSSDTEYEYSDPDVKAALDVLFNAINLSARSKLEIIDAVLWFLNNKDPNMTGTIIVAIKPDPNEDTQILLSIGRATDDEWYERGNEYLNSGDYTNAVTAYSEAIRLIANYAEAYFNRGRAYFNKNDFDRAIADFTEAIRLSPNSANAYGNRGNAYSSKNDYDRAIADYTQAIRLNPNLADAYNNRGNTYYLKQDYDRAIADYEAVLRIDPNHTTARNNLERARQARGN